MRKHSRFCVSDLFSTCCLFLIAVGLIAISANQAWSILPSNTGDLLPAASPATAKLAGNGDISTTTWNISAATQSTSWNAKRYVTSGAVKLAWGSPLPMVADLKNDAEITRVSLSFVGANAAELGVDGLSFTVSEITRAGKYTVVTVTPEHNGAPVYDSWVILSINQNGALALLKARSFARLPSGSFSLSADNANQIAASSIQAKVGEIRTEKVLLPTETTSSSLELRAAYRVEIDSELPHLQPTIYVDAESGEILAAENRVTFVEVAGSTQGWHFPLYGTDEQELAVFAYENLKYSDEDSLFSDENGSFDFEIDEGEFPITLQGTLDGRYVHVYEFEGEDGYYSMEYDDPEGEFDVIWTDDFASVDERNLYTHVNYIHDFWKSVAPNFDGLDRPINAICGMGGEGYEELEDNAFSSAQGLFFGRGNNLDNFAHYADVIYHEYTHSVTSSVYGGHPLPYEDESGALNEAWSDYFPCSLTDDHLMGEGGLIPNNGNIRNLENNLHYPEDIVGEVHADSRIISAAMWEVRGILGNQYSDSLLHFARYQYAQEFGEYLADVMLTDDDDGDLTNGTPHFRAIYNCFYRHGITALDIAQYTIRSISFSDVEDGEAIGNGNGIFDDEETIRIDVDIFRSGQLEPNDSDNTVVQFRSDHPNIDPIRPSVTIEQLAIGEGGALASPLLFDVIPVQEPSFADIVIWIGPEDGEMLPQDTIRVVLGNPEILLVEDGSKNGVDRKEYFTDVLEEKGIVYSEFTTRQPHVAIGDHLNFFQKIIWFTGDARADILNESSRAALANYLDNGGDLFITGQSAGDNPEATDFYRDYLGFTTLADSVSQNQQAHLIGVEGDWVAQGGDILLIGGQSARNQWRPSTVEAIAPAVEIFHYDMLEDEPAGAVRFENEANGSKTVFLGFGLEALSGVNRTLYQADLMQFVFNWFDGVNAAPELTETLPTELTLSGVYPNPFNSQIRIEFALPSAADVSLAIFDINGRAAMSTQRNFLAGAHQIAWNAEGMPAGVYFLKVASGDQVKTEKMLLVK